MAELNQYYTAPPYHINQPYDNTYVDHRNPPTYDQEYDYDSNYYGNSYNSRINPIEDHSLDNPITPLKNDNVGYSPHPDDDYHRTFSMSFFVKYFRYIPHINLTFNRVNDTFNPKSPVYQEVIFMNYSIVHIFQFIDIK